ncbi:MAG: transcriptional regulator NrdR [Bacillus thermozeamaize]|uniref:Transcriptional repressor NrdR n=1 Tax=Bacillus thermozeamaize TaxID=230954 RepID=A0A1Y3PNP9_9BACI|nr:MAG: transcriptional regulator NrdR [Bacillus thermozeamaize]
MRCPYCQHMGTRVLDSRPVNDGKSIRRRRECEQCNRRFTTFEMVEEAPLYVIKKDGTREEFSREKLLRGILRACEKRPIPIEQLETLVNEIEKELRSVVQSEVPSREIGEMVMRRLYDIDDVAYVRFASVYRQFKDIHVFLQELSEMLNTQRKEQRKEQGSE